MHNQLVKSGNSNLNYDAQGNLVTDSKREYIWDRDGRLTEIRARETGTTIASYKYDHKGRRIQATLRGLVTNFVYDGDSIQVLYETNARNEVTKSYSYSASGQILSMTQGGNTYFYHANAHGDIVKVTNRENEVVASYTYDAWGNITSQSGSFANENPYRYAGYRYDTESKFYYLIARYYNPETGSFISLDPDGGKLNDPQSQNGYNYANNNPVMGIDPDGHWVWLAINVLCAVRDGIDAYKSGAGFKGVAWAVGSNFIGGKFFKGLKKVFSAIKKVGRSIKNCRYYRRAFKFEKSAGLHMENPKRYVPNALLRKTIRGKGVKDTGGKKIGRPTNCKVYYNKMYKNGKPYKLKVVYHKRTNTIHHFHYEKIK